MAVIACVVIVFALLVIGEVWWQRQAVHGEFSRKFVHITVGSFVAVWPWFLTWTQIKVLSLAFLAVVLISKQFDLFRAIHSVQRPTWGEMYFALAVGLVAILTHDKWIYMASLLQMSLADGLAAVVGSRYGGRHKYLVLGHTKSVFGTATFFIVSMGILLALNSLFPAPLSIALLVLISGLASLIENVGGGGLDNLLVPLLVAVSLVNH